ncbi:hypothetical protein PBI_SMEAGOL_83 [Mycobacterium phage Smeagol]|nr:hypothetical protein PBI_SMEAGOL_83 [Mycobacterium phage Smeagol]
MAKRIQRKRTKGWRMPEGAIYVGRGSQWGNPWRVGSRLMTFTDLPDGLRQYAREFVMTPEIAVAFYREAFTPDADDIRAELSGRDLACWCPLDSLCHADVLLEIANSAAGEEA